MTCKFLFARPGRYNLCHERAQVPGYRVGRSLHSIGSVSLFTSHGGDRRGWYGSEWTSERTGITEVCNRPTVIDLRRNAEKSVAGGFFVKFLLPHFTVFAVVPLEIQNKLTPCQ